MVFLVGGAVRDLTSGSPVRDLDVVIQGNASKLKKELEKAGAMISGENESLQAIFVSFPGGVRMELGSTLSATYPKPGKPVFRPASLLDDLRRRDFTANAMALSLNEGSYGLLMDPTNGVADIENRELRLVSSYGFIEEPVRMIRAARLMARLGWSMEEKTAARYETGKQEGYISTMSSFHRGYETEEIFHEEDPLRVLRRLEEEGWMQHLFAPLSVAKANLTEMERLREAQTELQVHGIHADAAAANFPLLTAKLSAAEVAELKAMLPRQGFVGEIEQMDAEAKEFVAQMVAKTAALPSQAFQLIHRSRPEAVLWAAHTSKSGAFQGKLKSFYGEWPQVRQKIPYTLMQEMRIVPELRGYAELVEKLFYALLDGRLGTMEEMRAFLEPYSPPAPPPPVHMRRARAAKKDAKGGRGKKKAEVSADPDDEDAEMDEDRDAEEGDSASDREVTDDDVAEAEEKEIEEIEPVQTEAEVEPVAAKADPVSNPAPMAEVAQEAPASEAVGAKRAASRPGAKEAAAAQGRTVTAAKAAAAPKPSEKAAKEPEVKTRVAAKKAAPPAPASQKSSTKVVAKAPAKVAAKSAVKVAAKAPAKVAAKGKPAPAKKAPVAVGKGAPPAKKPAAPAKAVAKKAAPAQAKKAAAKAAPAKKGAKKTGR